jgi:hypothetical protein
MEPDSKTNGISSLKQPEGRELLIFIPRQVGSLGLVSLPREM